MPQTISATDRAAATAKARAAICNPRGSHRPEMTKRFATDTGPMLFRLCADCASWVDPTPIFSQDNVGGMVATAGTTLR